MQSTKSSFTFTYLRSRPASDCARRGVNKAHLRAADELISERALARSFAPCQQHWPPALAMTNSASADERASEIKWLRLRCVRALVCRSLVRATCACGARARARTMDIIITVPTITVISAPPPASGLSVSISAMRLRPRRRLTNQWTDKRRRRFDAAAAAARTVQ